MYGINLDSVKITMGIKNDDNSPEVATLVKSFGHSKYVNSKKEIARLNNTVNIAQNTRQHHEAKQSKDIATAKRSKLAANSLKGKSQETEAKKRNIIQKKLNEQFDLEP